MFFFPKSLFSVVGSLLVLAGLIILIIFAKKFTMKRGVYNTREAKGAKDLNNVDDALLTERTGPSESRGKEWWL